MKLLKYLCITHTYTRTPKHPTSLVWVLRHYTLLLVASSSHRETYGSRSIPSVKGALPKDFL